jgi:hypothetical protein
MEFCFVYGPIELEFCYGSTYPAVGLAWQLLAQVTDSEFEQNPRSSSWDIWKSPFVVSCERGFIMDLYDWKSDLPDNLWWNFPASDSTDFMKGVWIRGKAHS